MGIRMLFTGVDSIEGYQKKVLERIDERLHFEKCVLVQKVHDDLDIFEEEKYRLLNYDMCAHCRYEEFYDFNEFEPLSRELVRQMAPYENTAMRMLQRRYNFDVYEYDEQRRIYLQNLQFWNHIYETEQINYVVFTNIPHHTYDYMMYALAKIKGIRTCVLEVTVVNERYFACEDLEQDVVRVTYNEERDVKLPEDVELYYQVKKLDTTEDRSKIEEPKKVHMKEQWDAYFTDIKRKKVYRRYLAKIKQGMKAALLHHDTAVMTKNWAEIKENQRYVGRAYRKYHTMIPIKTYDDMAQLPDYSKPYIVYFLHLQPEATTLPMAGEFVDQILAIKILAKALEGTGIQLYVKEHFVQPCRESYFYSDIQKIKGVRLLKSTVDSKELLRHCKGISTCTGTVILEAIINGKPAFVFGNGMLNSAPGVFRITNVENCKAALACTQKEEFCIPEHHVRQFFKAFAEQTTAMYIYLNSETIKESLSVEQSGNNLADTVVEWYQKS
ncbi:MAG: hypothetical protein GX234_06340 [Clostridiales bacterium]|nr:hypothetical protein [Clostridiales bacterium]